MVIDADGNIFNETHSTKDCNDETPVERKDTSSEYE